MTANTGNLFGGDRESFDSGIGAGPGRPGQVIRLHPKTGQRCLDWLTWGLLPPTAAHSDGEPAPIHARAEIVADLPMFAGAFRHRRAIVPAAEYYQHRTIGAAGERYAIARRDGQPLAIAGLWEAFRRPDGEVVRTYCIITVEARGAVANIHDRMPLVLDEPDWPLWLGEAPGDPAALREPRTDDMLVLRPVRGGRSQAPTARAGNAARV